MRRLTAVFLTLMLTIAMLAVPALAEGGKPTLTVWVPENLRIEDWNTNDMTLWLEEQGGFDLDIVALASGDDFKTKVNMALIAGSISDLPDVIVCTNGTFSDTDVWDWAQAGAILPLTEYYNNPELAVNINEAIERCGVDYTKQITSPDGEIYAVATLNQSYGNEFPDKMWLSTTVLEAIGMEAPTTPDEFYEVLKAAVASDFNGNGKADEIGLLGTFSSLSYDGWFAYLMNPFVYAGDSNYRIVEDGTVSLAYTTEAWKEGLKYIRKLFEEGLIASESLTLEDAQYKTLMNSEQQVVFATDYYAIDMISDSERTLDYQIAAPLKGENGTQYATFKQSVANPTFLVTANCSNPEAAFRLGDLMSSEYIGISQRWGSEGVNWDYIANVEGADAYAASVDGFDISIVAYNDSAFWGGSEVANASWRQAGPYVRHYGIACGVGIDPENTEQYTINLNGAWTLYQTGGFNPDETISKLIYTTEESDSISEIESNLLTYVNEMTASFLMGNADIDASWDSFQAELENIGASTYVEVIQGVYDRMYK